MQIVIDIPEDYYKAIMEIPVNQATADMLIIKNGTPHESVTEFADRCRECGREKVLDKIRAEILALSAEPFHEFDYGYNLGLIGAARIIDKYKAESEKA